MPREGGGGRDLFIVDNGVSGWTGLRYIEEWAPIARSFDIATGDSLRARAVEKLDASLESTKEAKPFLEGAPAILEALRSRQIECRVNEKEKFRAKAYITHAKLEVVAGNRSTKETPPSAECPSRSWSRSEKWSRSTSTTGT